VKHHVFRLSRPLTIVTAALMLGVAALLFIPMQGTDIMQDYAAAWALRQGLDPNAPTSVLRKLCCDPDHPAGSEAIAFQTAHPPFVTMMFLPLAWLSWPTARLAWLIISWTAVLGAWRILNVPDRVRVATAPWWIFALGMGTLEPVIFVLIAVAIWAMSHGSRWAGVALGIATAIKIYPGLLIIGLWLAGRRAAALIAAATCISCMLIGEWMLGFGATMAWLGYMPINTAYFVDQAYNFSLPHIIRLIAPVASPIVASIIALTILCAPLIRRVMHTGRWTTLVPAMLFGTPLTWGSYLPLLSLAPLPGAALALLWLSGAANILATFELLLWMPAQMLVALVVVLPLIAISLAWYHQLSAPDQQWPATARPEFATSGKSTT